eukprot:6167828-Pyramimonas_sp.AAC.3
MCPLATERRLGAAAPARERVGVRVGGRADGQGGRAGCGGTRGEAAPAARRLGSAPPPHGGARRARVGGEENGVPAGDHGAATTPRGGACRCGALVPPARP